MSKSALSRPYLHDEKAAYAFVESQLWADGRPCPHCGVLDESVLLQGKSTRIAEGGGGCIHPDRRRKAVVIMKAARRRGAERASPEKARVRKPRPPR